MFSITLEIGVQHLWCCLPELAIVILSKFPTNFWKLRISLAPEYKELSNKKLDNNDA
jgi:hypothetical protein